MRPDLDDFEEMNQEPGAEPRSRAMSWLVLGVAVSGFAALAYYAYQSGTRAGNDGNILVVNAEQGPVKEAPADPGGEEFPNKDKTIYNALAPDGGQKVEKLLPDSEQPVVPAPVVGTTATQAKAENGTTTFVNNAVTEKEEDEDDANPQKVTAEAAKPAETKPASPAVPAGAATISAPAKAAAAPASSAKAVAPAPTTVPEEVKEKPVAATAKPVEKPAAKTQSAASGSYKIQLGAFKSQEEAKQNWSRIQAKHSDVLKGAPIILRADLPGGTFYRLRASGYASAEAAKSACGKLSAAGQACFYVGK
jgi:hypothetical protein